MPGAGSRLGPLALALGLWIAMLLGALAGQAPLAAAVALAQAMLAYGWYGLLDVPGRVAGGAIVLGAGVAGDAAILAHDGEPTTGPLAVVLAGAALASIVHQLARTDGRDRITASLSATLGAASLSVLGGALVAARDIPDGRAVTVAAVLAAGGATVAATVPLPPARFEPLVFAAGFAQGLVGGGLVGDMPTRQVAAVAAAGAALGVAARRAAEYLAYEEAQRGAADRQARRAAAEAGRRPAGAGMLLGSTLPVVCAAPAAYVLGRLLVG